MEDKISYKNIVAARDSIAKTILSLDKMLDVQESDVFNIAKAQTELTPLLIALETIISDYEETGKMSKYYLGTNI